MSPKPLSYPNTVDVNPISNLLDTALPLGILTVQELLDYRTVARSTVKSTLAFLEKKKVKYAIFKAMRDSIADSTDPLFDTVKGLTERLLQELVVIESVLMDHIKLVNNIKLQYLFQTAEIQISKQKTYTHPTMSNEAVTKQVQIISNVVSKEFNQLKDLVLQSPPSFITEAQQKLLHMHVKRDTVESSLVETVLSPALKALKLKCREVFPLILV